MRGALSSPHPLSSSQEMDTILEVDEDVSTVTDYTDGTVSNAIETLLPVEEESAAARVDRKRVAKRVTLILGAVVLVLVVLLTGGSQLLRPNGETDVLLNSSLRRLASTLNSSTAENATSTANAGR